MHYKPILAGYNLDAWSHIKAMNFRMTPGYNGHLVQIDNHTSLIWKENEGNFYYRYAPFAWAVTLNLYKELMFLNIDPAVQKIKSVKLVITGFHGGKRREQDEQIELLINDKIYKIAFGTPEVRNEEVIVINISPQDLIISPTASMNFAIIVLPFHEKYPIPPPHSKYPQMGPAHFRDIEIGDSYLEVSI